MNLPSKEFEPKAALPTPGAIDLCVFQELEFTKYLINKADEGALAAFLFKGKGTRNEAQYAAAKEWASIAVPAGLHIDLNCGGHVSDGTFSYYESPANHASKGATEKLQIALSTAEAMHSP